VLNLKEIVGHFVAHRHEVVVRRTRYELQKALDREHILEGLKIAVDNIDEVIQIIRGSATTDEAGERLRSRFELSERQSDAILNMRLARLTGLEIEQLEAELAEVRATIADLRRASWTAATAATPSSRMSCRRSPTSTATSGAPGSWSTPAPCRSRT
jgi:DNA gyrase subunit A